MPRPKLTQLAVAILELLHEKPMHPYEMAQLMRDRQLDCRVNIKAGSLYHTVDRLAAAEYIEVVDTQREGRRPERTVYGITPAGRDAFVERAITMISAVAPEYPEYVSGLAVLDELDRDVVLAQLRNRCIRLEAAIASHEAVLKGLREQRLPEIYWLDWQYVAAKQRFELDWTRQLIDDIEAGELAWQAKCPDRRALTAVEQTEQPEGRADDRQAS